MDSYFGCQVDLKTKQNKTENNSENNPSSDDCQYETCSNTDCVSQKTTLTCFHVLQRLTFNTFMKR